MSKQDMRLGLIAVAATVSLLTACSDPEPNGYSGYIEGEYVRVAAPFAGELALLQVKRGDTVAAGAPLFALEQDSEKAARAEAQARVRQAQAKLADLNKGRRPQELDSVRAQLAQAEANLRLATSELKRNEELLAAGFISPAKLDEVRSNAQRDEARVRQLKADLAVARLAARPDEIAAASAEVKMASDALAQAEWKLQQKSQTATQAGLVADTLFNQGEWVPAGAPVVSMLPPQNVKARFFVPERQVGALRLGQSVSIRCDGCAEVVEATLTFIAPEAEYTPPVIYSRENRAKLVFMVEARPRVEQAMHLHPGQPIVAQLTATRVAQDR
jgi:HlyD family secretion protein